jgi:hypothetical protein
MRQARTQATFRQLDCLLTSLKDKLIKIGAKVVSHGRHVAFQMAEVAIPANVPEILRLTPNCGSSHHQRQRETFDGRVFSALGLFAQQA